MNGCGVRIIGPNNYVPKLIVNLICVPPLIWIHFRGTPTVSHGQEHCLWSGQYDPRL